MGQATLIVRKDKPLNQIHSADEIAGYRIGSVKSSTGKYPPLIDDNRDRINLEELGGRWMGGSKFKEISGRQVGRNI